jgi:hypothetical protein
MTAVTRLTPLAAPGPIAWLAARVRRCAVVALVGVGAGWWAPQALAADDALAKRMAAFYKARDEDQQAVARAVLDELVAKAYPPAVARLGNALRRGEAWYGAGTDHARAYTLLEQAWAGGSSAAANGLAFMHQNGDGRPKDMAQAIAWFRKAADAGHDVALATLGVMAYRGKDMPQDCREAERLYKLAISGGNSVSKYNLGILYDRGCPDFPAQADSALHWMKESAKDGDTDAKAYVAKREEPPKFVVRPLPGPSAAQTQLFSNALRAAAQMGFKADQIDNTNCEASLRHNYQGKEVKLNLRVPNGGRLNGNVLIADDNVRTGFIRLYRQELAKVLNVATVDIDGNISGE